MENDSDENTDNRRQDVDAAFKKRLGDIKVMSVESQKDSLHYFEVNNGFFDKLAALSSGSIAVAASVYGLLLTKYLSVDVILARWLFAVVLCFFASLVCAVVGNYLAVRITELYSKRSELEMNKEIETVFTIMTRSLNGSTGDEIAKALHEIAPITDLTCCKIPFIEKLQKVCRNISVCCFLIGYGAVVLKLYLLVFSCGK
jgi:hypothetical protein